MSKKREEVSSTGKRAFNLPKRYKMIASGILDAHKRGEYIRSMISALQTEQDWKNRRRQMAEKVDED